jgi:D-alanyl-D-alanine carboxypeptidase (penicillin-binding protein 5/6)
MDTGHTLADVNGEKPLPMASTTKIMTALIAIRTGDLNQLITIKQDAYDEYFEHDGSNAGLAVGEQLTLKDLLYALMVPSGDDAAIAIADALGGTTDNFVQWMNLFAYRLHLFQTHYADPDGLNWHNDPDHYTTAADLTRLADYAMQIPLFAQIVQTQSYSIAASAQHSAHSWKTTNTLLATYTGMLGIKTGHTDAAGYCLVFAAEQNGHHLIGTVLHSASEVQRDKDANMLLNWGFALPLLPPG